MKGFSTLEMMIAMAIMTVTLTAVIVVSFGTQGALVGGETNSEAMNIAQKSLEQEQQLARKDFRLVSATTSQWDIYTGTTTVDPWAGEPYTSKKITATVSWKDQHQQDHFVTLTTILSNFMNAVGGDTCAAPTGTWSAPQGTDYAFNTTSLISTPGVYTLAGLDAYRGKLYVGAQSAPSGQPTFFVFDIANPPHKPILLGGVNTVPSASASQRGPRDIVAGNSAMLSGVVHSYVYAANGYNADYNSCALSDKCSQLQVLDVTDPLHPSVVVNFKFATSSQSVPNSLPYVSGSAGQAYGETLFYNQGYLYVGLHTAGSGPEFAILDVHDPLNPHAIGPGYDVGAEVHAISVRGKFAYLATGNSGNELLVLDVSNPFTPTPVTNVFNPPGLNAGASIYTIGDSLYFGKQYAGGQPEFYILDITNPLSAVPLVSATSKKVLGSSIAGLVVRNTLAHVLTSTSRALYTYLIADPSNISQYASPIAMPGDGVALDCELNYLYAASNNGTTGYISLITPAP